MSFLENLSGKRFIISAIFMSLFFLRVPAFALKTIHVNPDESIQAAIDRAETGSVVTAFPGTYYESIKLKRGVSLKSKEGPDVTIINGGKGVDVVVSMADDSVLEGFTITGRRSAENPDENLTGKGAVQCINVSATIKNNIIRNNYSSGISVSGEKAAPTISENQIYLNSLSGIGCDNKSSGTILKNAIYENGLAGIGIQRGSSPLVVDNQCYKNKYSGVGIRDKESVPIIRGNRIYQNLFSGIGVERGGKPTLEDNNIFENQKAGIGIKDSSNVLATGNVVQRNVLAGIGVLDHSVVVIKNNIIAENTLAAISVMNASTAEIADCDINNNGTIGIVVNKSRINIYKNRVYMNTHHGISVHRSSSGEIYENRIYNNGKDEKRGAGILAVSSNGLVVRDNEFYDNYGPGVYVHYCSPEVKKNTFINDEVLAKKYSVPVIKENIFYSRGKNGKEGKGGVAAREHSVPIVLNNKFLGRFGIGSYKNSFPVIIGNLFSGSDESSVSTGRSGVKVIGNSRALILNNRFFNGNRIFCNGIYLADNMNTERYENGEIIKMVGENLNIIKKAIEKKDIEKDLALLSRKRRKRKFTKALTGVERKLYGTVIQNNLFLSE